MTPPSCFIAAALVLLGTMLAAEEPRGRRTTPENLPEVIQTLEEIRDGYRRHQKNLPWHRLQGTLQPGGLELVLARRNEQARFEVEYDHPNLRRQRLYCLTDGRSLLRLDHEALNVYPVGLKNNSWINLCDGWDFYAAIPSLDGDMRQEVDEFCQCLIQFLQGKGKYGRHFHRVHSGEVAVAVESTPTNRGLGTRTIVVSSDDNGRNGCEITVDADKGYQFTRWRRTQANEDAAKWTRIDTIENDYRQLPNGDWVLSSGRFTVNETGSIAEQDGRPAFWSKEMKVHSAETVESFADPDYFSLKSLPIHRKILVHDHRYAPTRSTLTEDWRTADFFLDLLAELESGSP